MNHSKIVGGSTAKRVINCPGSVALVATMPQQEGSSYANEGSLLHEAIAIVMDTGCAPEDMVGFEAHGLTLTDELLERKLLPALALLADYDPQATMEFEVEQTVDFGEFLPGVFGSSDIVGRLDGKAVILDWKFGDGVMVEAEESEQLLFYAAAAMRTPSCAWAFEGVTEVECVIIQPPFLRTWTTTVERIAEFERQLVRAVNTAGLPRAPLVLIMKMGLMLGCCTVSLPRTSGWSPIAFIIAAATVLEVWVQMSTTLLYFSPEVISPS
jgi:hypothetical protein